MRVHHAHAPPTRAQTSAGGACTWTGIDGAARAHLAKGALADGLALFGGDISATLVNETLSDPENNDLAIDPTLAVFVEKATGVACYLSQSLRVYATLPGRCTTGAGDFPASLSAPSPASLSALRFPAPRLVL